MRIAWTALGCLVVAASLVILGCHERRERERTVVVREEPRVVEEPPVVVEERPARVIIVREAPPPPLVEVCPASPGPDFVWIGGFYCWHESDHRYIWTRGHYARAPYRGAHWEPDRWEHTSKGHEYHPGHWK